MVHKVIIIKMARSMKNTKMKQDYQQNTGGPVDGKIEKKSMERFKENKFRHFALAFDYYQYVFGHQSGRCSGYDC